MMDDSNGPDSANDVSAGARYSTQGVERPVNRSYTRGGRSGSARYK
jgi:hypothetical protein